MNTFKGGPMLTEIVQEQSSHSSASGSDLSALAEHLSVIADALRKTGSPGLIPSDSSRADHETGKTPTRAFARQSETLVDVQIPKMDAKVQRAVYAELAREAYATRRRRSTIFSNDELFGEPAWDILLDLYVAHAENTPVSVSSACIGSAAPPTTGLRWLGVLAEQGLILRQHDPEDQRRVLVRLTDKGLSAMDEYFASVGLTA